MLQCLVKDNILLMRGVLTQNGTNGRKGIADSVHSLRMYREEKSRYLCINVTNNDSFVAHLNTIKPVIGGTAKIKIKYKQSQGNEVLFILHKWNIRVDNEVIDL